MDLRIPLYGLAIGLALAVPVGPIGLLVFRRSLLHHARAGIVTGLGAALADATLCGILSFGITAISDFITLHSRLLVNVSGFVLVAIGYAVWHTAPPHEMPKTRPPRPGWFGAFSTALVLTISNPMTIVGAGGIFAAFAVGARVVRPVDAVMLVGGVFAGSMLWWTILSNLASKLRDKASGYWMRRINQGCGIAIGVFGLVQIVRFALAALQP
jgi:threonine/homoserine/homoserine lactone efflux protein